MRINVGDKLVFTKNMSGFFNEGDIVEVTNVNGNMVSFACHNADTESHIRIARSGQMNIDTCNQYFVKFEEENEDAHVFEVTVEEIAVSVEEIMENSEFETHSILDNSIVVSCRLPNGYVITESYSCTSGNYDAELAEEICHERIYNKIWELETYRFKQLIWEASEASMEECECTCDGNCAECVYNEESNHNGLLN